MATKKVKIAITGTRPLMWHALDIENFGSKTGERKEKTGSAGNDPEEWRRTHRATPEGQLYLVPEMIFGAMRNAAVYTKKGRGSIQKAVAATLQVQDTKILLDRFMFTEPTADPEQPVYIDIRGVVNPTNKAHNIRYRVTTREGWKCAFTLIFDSTIVDEVSIKAVAIDAGRLIGLGDGRSIGYGRFEVDSFDLVK